jgi:hypothetical protein
VKVLATVQQFADACKLLSNSIEIYELFENGITPELRDTIYSQYEDTETLEPTRAALYMIGVQYDVQSLKDY